MGATESRCFEGRCAPSSCQSSLRDADAKADAEVLLQSVVRDEVSSSTVSDALPVLRQSVMRAGPTFHSAYFSAPSIADTSTIRNPLFSVSKTWSRDDDNPKETPRREPFVVELKRVGEHWRTLGLLLDPDEDPNVVVVQDCWAPSLIDQWNQLRPEQERVRPGDLILSVNDVSGSSDEIVTAIQVLGRGSTMRLRIQ